MTDIRRVGIDLAKKIFHVTVVDENGAVLERKCLRRAAAVLILGVVRGSGRVRGVRLMSGWEWDAEFRAAGRRYRR